MYLIYETEEASIERADEEGKYHNFSYWIEGKGTTYSSIKFKIRSRGIGI